MGIPTPTSPGGSNHPPPPDIVETVDDTNVDSDSAESVSVSASASASKTESSEAQTEPQTDQDTRVSETNTVLPSPFFGKFPCSEFAKKIAREERTPESLKKKKSKGPGSRSANNSPAMRKIQWISDLNNSVNNLNKEVVQSVNNLNKDCADNNFKLETNVIALSREFKNMVSHLQNLEGQITVLTDRLDQVDTSVSNLVRGEIPLTETSGIQNTVRELVTRYDRCTRSLGADHSRLKERVDDMIRSNSQYQQYYVNGHKRPRQDQEQPNPEKTVSGQTSVPNTSGPGAIPRELPAIPRRMSASSSNSIIFTEISTPITQERLSRANGVINGVYHGSPNGASGPVPMEVVSEAAATPPVHPEQNRTVQNSNQTIQHGSLANVVNKNGKTSLQKPTRTPRPRNPQARDEDQDRQLWKDQQNPTETLKQQASKDRNQNRNQNEPSAPKTTSENQGRKPARSPPSYANAASAAKIPSPPPGLNQDGARYHHSQNNNRGPTPPRSPPKGNNRLDQQRTVKNDYLKINRDGNVDIVKDFKTVPTRTEKQVKRDNNRHKKNLEEVVCESVLFGIPTRNSDGNIASKASDMAHVVRILRELIRGGYEVKDGHVVETVRQWKNTRHPAEIPITITFSDAEVRTEAMTAAAEAGLAGARFPRRGDVEEGRIGYLRKSLTERERKNIRQNREWRESKQGIAYIEVKTREEDSRADTDDWAGFRIEAESGNQSPRSTSSNGSNNNNNTNRRETVQQNQDLLKQNEQLLKKLQEMESGEMENRRLRSLNYPPAQTSREQANREHANQTNQDIFNWQNQQSRGWNADTWNETDSNTGGMEMTTDTPRNNGGPGGPPPPGHFRSGFNLSTDTPRNQGGPGGPPPPGHFRSGFNLSTDTPRNQGGPGGPPPPADFRSGFNFNSTNNLNLRNPHANNIRDRPQEKQDLPESTESTENSTKESQPPESAEDRSKESQPPPENTGDASSQEATWA